MMKTPLLALLAFSSFAMGIAGGADAQTWWRTVASAGTVDEADLGQVDLNGGAAGIKPEVVSGSVVIRYNVVPADNFFEEGSCAALDAVFVDPGTTSQVVVELRGVTFHPTSGLTETRLLTIDSNTLDQSPKPQFFRQASDKTHAGLQAFYIEVSLKKLPGGNPKLHSLAVRRTSCSG